MPSVGAVTSNLTVTSQSGTTYTAKANDLVLADASLNAVTVTLPTAPITNSVIAVKKSDTGTNTVVVVPGGTSKIDGDSAGVTLTATGAAVTVQYDGTNWRILSTGTIGGGAGSSAGVTTVIENPGFISGNWYDRRNTSGPSSLLPSSSTLTTANVIYGSFFLPKATTFTGVGYTTGTTAPTAMTLRVGAFTSNPTSGGPQTLIADMGVITVTETANTFSSLTGLNFTLPAGWFYLALSASATATGNCYGYTSSTVGFLGPAGLPTAFVTNSYFTNSPGPAYWTTAGTNAAAFGTPGVTTVTATPFYPTSNTTFPLIFLRAA